MTNCAILVQICPAPRLTPLCVLCQICSFPHHTVLFHDLPTHLPPIVSRRCLTRPDTFGKSSTHEKNQKIQISKLSMFQILRVRRPASDHTSTHDTADRSSTYTRFSTSDAACLQTQFHPYCSRRFIPISMLRPTVFTPWSPLTFPPILLLTAVPLTSDSVYQHTVPPTLLLTTDSTPGLEYPC